jgi:hypothetical protein
MKIVTQGDEGKLAYLDKDGTGFVMANGHPYEVSHNEAKAFRDGGSKAVKDHCGDYSGKKAADAGCLVTIRAAVFVVEEMGRQTLVEVDIPTTVVGGLRGLGIPVSHVEYVYAGQGCQYTHSVPGKRYGWFSPRDGGEVMVVFDRDVDDAELRSVKKWFSEREFGIFDRKEP